MLRWQSASRKGGSGFMIPLKGYAMALLLVSMPLMGVPQREKNERAQAYANEQALFSSEDESVERPVVLSESAIEAVRQAEKPARKDLNSKTLVASVIHLDGADEKDLIVIGMDGLRGAHIVPFWVLRNTNRGYEVVLATRGDGLKVLGTKWKGYRNIEMYNLAAGAVQTTTYRFDGSEYRRSGVISSPSR